MSTRRKSRREGGDSPRRIAVRGVRREPPDLRRLSRALIQLALQQAAAEAAAEQQAADATKGNPPEEPRV